MVAIFGVIETSLVMKQVEMIYTKHIFITMVNSVHCIHCETLGIHQTFGIKQALRLPFKTQETIIKPDMDNTMAL